MNDEIFRVMMRVAFATHLQLVQKIDNQACEKIQEAFHGTNKLNMRRKYLENHPSIQTNVTDEDMLLLQIDMALDSGDAERFMQLTDELKGMVGEYEKMSLPIS